MEVPVSVWQWLADDDGALSGGDGGEHWLWVCADAGPAGTVGAGADGLRRGGGAGAGFAAAGSASHWALHHRAGAEH